MRRIAHALAILVISASSAVAVGSAPALADTSTLNWGQQSPAQSPPGRTYAAMDYDSRRGRAVMVAGGTGSSTTFGDTWEWDGSHWSLVSTSGPNAITPVAAYDPVRGVSVVFDGTSTWEWDGTTWTKRVTASSPPTRVWTAMAYDAARARMVLFGGSVAGNSNGDTWTYDGNNWTQMSPASAPSPRLGSALAFDPTRNVVVLFGGWASGTRMNDTWTWDGANWTQQSPATVPFARFLHSMVYDAQIGAVVMFGGDHIEPFSLGPENDTWTWDGANWSQDWPSAAPSPRAGAAMAYESASGRVVLFGGNAETNPDTFFADTWELGQGITTPVGSPSLFTNPPNVAFGSTAIGSTAGPASIFVTNSGTGPMTFSSISTSGPFAISNMNCPVAPFPLAAGAYCRISVTYSPTACVMGLGSLTFVDNGPGGSQSVPLQGQAPPAGCDADLVLVQQRNFSANATSPAGAVVNYQLPIALDEEATPPPITCNPAPGSLFPIGTTTVSCSTTDPDDTPSTVSTTFPITVFDTDLSLSGVPADFSVNATSPSGAVVTFATPSASDEDTTSSAVTCTPASGSTFAIGTTAVTCTTSDSDDNPSSASATFNITVLDTDLGLPTPGDITVNATSPSGATVTFGTPTATDEDSTAASVVCDHASGATYPIGTTKVQCQVFDPDDNPNSVMVSFVINVNDTDLAISGVTDITVNATSPAGATVTYAMPAAVDEDGIQPVESCDHASGATFQIGTTKVTCTASDLDDSPSSVSTTFSVTVNDTDLAWSSVPSDVTVDATDHFGAAVSFNPPRAVDEDPSSPAISCTHASGSIFPIGTTTVTCTAVDSDDSPSSITTVFHVTVRDTDLGFNNVPADFTVVATGASGALVTFRPPISADEDGGAATTATCSPASSTVLPVGTTTVTCQVSDSDDIPSTATTTFHVTVVPDIQVAATVTPTSATSHTTVTTTAAVTNIGAASEKVSINYAVTFTDSSGHTTTVASDKATVTVDAGQSMTRQFFFAVKSTTAPGTYAVTVTAIDVTGSVTQAGGFTVT